MTDKERMNCEMAEKMVVTEAEKLAEHFDSVLIIVTSVDGQFGGGTFRCSVSRGNLYASLGIAKAWIIKQDKIDVDIAEDGDGEDDEE